MARTAVTPPATIEAIRPPLRRRADVCGLFLCMSSPVLESWRTPRRETRRSGCSLCEHGPVNRQQAAETAATARRGGGANPTPFDERESGGDVALDVVHGVIG